MALNCVGVCFTIFCIHFGLYFHQTSAQQGFINFFCSNGIGNYTQNSTFQANLNTILTSAASNVNSFGFYNATAGQAGTDQVNAIAYCRGDVDIDSCRDCVNNAANNLTIVCPNQKEAIGWSDVCMFRYSNKSIFGIMTLDPGWTLVNPQGASNLNVFTQQFTQEVNLLASNLLIQAYNGTFRKFAAGQSNNPNVPTIYAYMQCTPDITSGDCMLCLNSTATGMSDCCSNQVGARYETPSCSFHYETFSFLNLSSFPPPPPPPAAVAPSSTSTPPAPAPSSTSTGNSRKSKTTIIIVCVVVALLILTLAVCVFITRRRWLNAMRGKKLKEEEEEEEEMEAMGGTEMNQYDFASIRAATEDFSLANKLGRGGFGDVFKGVLSDGKEIAVKRLSKTSGQGEKEFRNEVMLVAKLQHKCLVRLLGFCLEKTERLLVYEFLANGSLDKILFDQVKRSRLDWEKRYRIIQSIAKGLLYLHEDSRLRIIHRDLKASNILLDEDMNAKISDFGMARLFGLDETEANTNRIAGTYGYMAPEYAMHGLFSGKSDVYSYGVLLLEIVSGKRNYSSLTEERVEDLLSYAYNTWRQGEASELIDPMLKANSDSLENIVRCVHIALLCVQENVGSRPTMAAVVLMLQSLTLALPTPSEPGFFSNTGIIASRRSSLSGFPESSSSSSQSRLPLVHAANNDRTLYEASDSHLNPR